MKSKQYDFTKEKNHAGKFNCFFFPCGSSYEINR